MSEEEALLRAICAHPDDDTPRLVYADWLDENSQPERAEFIRVQVAHARAFFPGGITAKPSAREKSLLKQHASAWFKPPAGWMLDRHYLVWRGFPYAVLCTYEAYRDHQDVFVRWPITRLRPSLDMDNTEQACRFAEVSLPANVRELDLYYSSVGSEALRILLAAPALDGVVWLNIGCCFFGGKEGAMFLAQNPHLPNLRHLDLIGNRITTGGLRALIESEYCGSVESLNLSGNSVTATDVAAFLHSHHWRRLTDLCLWNTDFGDEMVGQLAACSDLARLTALNLNSNNITDDGVRALAASPSVRNLRALSLATNKLTPACAEALIGSPYLRDLKYLRLSDNNIQRRDRRQFVERFGTGVSFKLT
jgi:uncharacterized protein (TIGR02996 family)